MIDLTQLSGPELDELEIAIEEEKRQRLLVVLRTQPNTAVISIRSGFSGGPGQLMFCVDERKKGEVCERQRDLKGEWQDVTSGGDYFGLSDRPNGKVKWLVSPDDVLHALRLARKDEYEPVPSNT